MRRLALTIPLVAGAGCLFESNPDFDEVDEAQSDGAEDGTDSEGTATGGDDDDDASSTASDDDDDDATDDATGGDDDDDDDDDSACIDPDRMPWWDTAWRRRRPIAVDNTAQLRDLGDFPLRVPLPMNVFSYAQANMDGSDIRFVAPGHAEALATHRDIWVYNVGADFWVRTPTIGGAVLDVGAVWVYYDNDEASLDEDPAASYDDDTVAVWHLGEDPGERTVANVRGEACDWSGGAEGAQGAAGQVGQCVSLDGVDSGVTCGEDYLPGLPQSTIGAWVNLPLTGDAEQLILSAQDPAMPDGGLALGVRASDGAVGRPWSGGWTFAEDVSIPGDTWTFVAMRTQRDGRNGYIEVAVDGGEWERIIQGDTSAAALPASHAVALGRSVAKGTAASLMGRLDEITISSTLRSDDWVRATYATGRGEMTQLYNEEVLCN